MSVHRRLCWQFYRTQCFFRSFKQNSYNICLYERSVYPWKRICNSLIKSWVKYVSGAPEVEGVFYGMRVIALTFICPMVYVVFPRKEKIPNMNPFFLLQCHYTKFLLLSFLMNFGRYDDPVVRGWWEWMFCDYAMDLCCCSIFSNALVNHLHVDCSLGVYVHVAHVYTGGFFTETEFLFIMVE